MALEGKTRILNSPNARTQYITIPAAIVIDSQYPFKGNEEVYVYVDPKLEIIEIRKEEKIFKTEENTYKQLKENIYKPGALGISCSALLMGLLSLIWSPYLAIPLLGLGAYSYWVYRKLSV